MSGSTYTRVALRLLELLGQSEVVAEGGVQLSYGAPTESAAECMYTSSLRNSEETPKGMRAGRAPRYETYEFEFFIEVATDGTQQQADERCAELAAELWHILQESPGPRLGWGNAPEEAGRGVTVEIARWNQVHVQLPEGRGTSRQVTIRVNASI